MGLDSIYIRLVKQVGRLKGDHWLLERKADALGRDEKIKRYLMDLDDDVRRRIEKGETVWYIRPDLKKAMRDLGGEDENQKEGEEKKQEKK